MVDEAKALSGSISRRASEVRAYVADLDVPGRIRENPLAFAGAAIALGYFLGGGLFSRPTGWLLKNGFRIAMLFVGAQAVTSGASIESAPPPPKTNRATSSRSRGRSENARGRRSPASEEP